MSEQGSVERVVELVKESKVAMMTYVDGDGHLVSKPMATQDVDFDGDLWFIVARDSQKVRDLVARPQVNISYSARGTWVSVAGTAEVVDDVERLKELWSTFTDSWLDGGPENPDNVLLHVSAETAEYWDSPGGAVVSLANVVKAKVTGERVEGENETVDLG